MHKYRSKLVYVNKLFLHVVPHLAGYASPDSLALAFTKQRPALTAPSCSKQHVRDEKVCEGDSKPLMCDLCQLSLSSQSQAEDHYKGSRHAKKQKAAQLYSNVLITVGQAGKELLGWPGAPFLHTEVE